ncbi:MAG TPA: class I SAM-dependent methyltransferase [Candidatus Paceibacterota bacterium]
MRQIPPEDPVERRFLNVSNSKTFRNIGDAFELKKKMVLDIGCSYGEHLAHFGKESTGITINPTESEIGKARGLDVRLGNAEERLPINRTYDAIYCSNLLEHLHGPHRFLHDIRSALKPDGILILGVPVIPSPSTLMRLRKFRGALANSHINFFTANSLRLTVERAGWSVETVRGFRVRNAPADRLIRWLYPHLYVVATPIADFEYSAKRKLELAGYH